MEFSQISMQNFTNILNLIYNVVGIPQKTLVGSYFLVGEQLSYSPYCPPVGKPLGRTYPPYVGPYVGGNYPTFGQIPQLGLSQPVVTQPLIGASFLGMEGTFWNPTFGDVPHLLSSQTVQATF